MLDKSFRELRPANSEKKDERKKYMKTVTKFISAAFAAVTLAMGTPTANAFRGDIFASINGMTGVNGVGSIFDYTPVGVQYTFASGLDRSRGIAFDGQANLFVATNFFDGTFRATILKITPLGVQSIFGTLSGNLSAEGMAIDHSDNVFVVAIDETSPTLDSTIVKFTPSGVQSPFGDAGDQAFGLAFDSAGNLFSAATGDPAGGSQTIFKFTPDGTQSIFVGPSAFGPLQGPTGLTFDRSGNLFVSTESGGQEPDAILKFTPDGVESTFATGLKFPRGVAFDSGGNLFVAEIIQDAPGDILKFTPDGNRTVFASGIGVGGNSGPEFLVIQPARPPTPRHRPTPAPRPR